MRTYELHTFSNGKWAFNFVFGDSRTALEEAKQLERGGRHTVVCVTEEIFDEATNTASSRTIFRAGERQAVRRLAANRARHDRARSRPAAGWDVRFERGGSSLRTWGIIGPFLVLVVLTAAGLGALAALQFLV